MTFDPPTLPPAGWYPDPEGSGRERYWNGASWADAWQDGGTEGYPDVGQWLAEAFRSMWRHVRAEAVVAVLTGVPASVMVALALRVAVDDLSVVDNEIVGWDDDRLPTLAVLGAFAIVLFTVGALATTWLGLRVADRNDDAAPPPIPRDVDTGSELRFAFQAIGGALRATPRALAWTLLVVACLVPVLVATIALTILAPPLIVVFVLGAIPVGIWLAVRLSFTYVAIVDRPGNPFSRSWEVTRHRFWSTFGRLLLLTLITSAISIAVNAVTSQFGDDASTFGQETIIELDEDGNIERLEIETLRPDTIGIVAGAIGAVATGVLATGTSSIAYGRLYRDGGMPASR